jgi:hypothetical protein
MGWRRKRGVLIFVSGQEFLFYFIFCGKNERNTPLKETKILQDFIITLLELISQVFNTSQNIILQKSSYKNRPIIIIIIIIT